jgi:hypothetical protein
MFFIILQDQHRPDSRLICPSLFLIAGHAQKKRPSFTPLQLKCVEINCTALHNFGNAGSKQTYALWNDLTGRDARPPLPPECALIKITSFTHTQAYVFKFCPCFCLARLSYS